MDIQNISTDQLIPYINNPRNNANAVDKVAASIKEFGFKVPIVVDKEKVVVAGHTRLLAAKKLGMTEVPCIIADDLNDQQIKAFRLADNKVSEFAEWNISILETELSDLEFAGFEMEPFGFIPPKAEVAEDDFDIDAALPEVPTTKIGDVWEIGNHRLMCGDATNLDDVQKLMSDVEADMVFTDPPYNVNYEGGTKEKLKIKNDNMKNDQFFQFLYDSFVNMFAVTKPGGQYTFVMPIQKE